MESDGVANTVGNEVEDEVTRPRAASDVVGTKTSWPYLPYHRIHPSETARVRF
jgi:hypothetical protein